MTQRRKNYATLTIITELPLAEAEQLLAEIEELKADEANYVTWGAVSIHVPSTAILGYSYQPLTHPIEDHEKELAREYHGLSRIWKGK